MNTVFKTKARAQEVSPSQPIVPIAITLNDRAATREAIIQKVSSLGYKFVERSSWGAAKQNTGMASDWDYTMIALHHAGRSYSCSAGSEQMRDVQVMQMDKGYDDIGYHYGIDCEGAIYEGRDIRFKGSNVHNFNTGVIGIVLLNNLTTAGEGGDMVALGRESLEYLGISTTNTISAKQIDALMALINALKGVFVLKHFGGHREYPGQTAEGKICPGNVGMELVRAIRMQTNLLSPPMPKI